MNDITATFTAAEVAAMCKALIAQNESLAQRIEELRQGNEDVREELHAALMSLDAERSAAASAAHDYDEEVNQLRAELEATKKAKAENDERFMGERDAARSLADAIRHELARLNSEKILDRPPNPPGVIPWALVPDVTLQNQPTMEQGSAGPT